MLSVLIPVYNYEIIDLVNAVYKQGINSHVAFEIIIGDDCSDKKIDQSALKGKNITFFRNKTNIGRTETRQKLAQKAQYKWLLFLDADVLPVNSNFIKKYIEFIKTERFDVCFGGFKYYNTPPDATKILRWKYGKTKEDITATIRNKKPYKVIISANLLISKSLFLNINTDLKGNHYGYDNIFSLQLKNKKAKVIHIENPVWHLGLEPNETYLLKKESAAKTILMLYKAKKINAGSNDLLKTFELIKKLKCVYIIDFLFKKTKPILRKNILSKNPSINLLNLYRLGYLCKVYKLNQE